jgi:hypothetical protein
MPVDEIKRLGRATQGVIVMRLRGDERVSSLAPVVESDEDDADVAGADIPAGTAAEPAADGPDQAVEPVEDED